MVAKVKKSFLKNGFQMFCYKNFLSSTTHKQEEQQRIEQEKKKSLNDITNTISNTPLMNKTGSHSMSTPDLSTMQSSNEDFLSNPTGNSNNRYPDYKHRKNIVKLVKAKSGNKTITHLLVLNERKQANDLKHQQQQPIQQNSTKQPSSSSSNINRNSPSTPTPTHQQAQNETNRNVVVLSNVQTRNYDNNIEASNAKSSPECTERVETKRPQTLKTNGSLSQTQMSESKNFSLKNGDLIGTSANNKMISKSSIINTDKKNVKQQQHPRSMSANSKKVVRFADSLGLELESIITMNALDATKQIRRVRLARNYPNVSNAINVNANTTANRNSFHEELLVSNPNQVSVNNYVQYSNTNVLPYSEFIVEQQQKQPSTHEQQPQQPVNKSAISKASQSNDGIVTSSRNYELINKIAHRNYENQTNVNNYSDENYSYLAPSQQADQATSQSPSCPSTRTLNSNTGANGELLRDDLNFYDDLMNHITIRDQQQPNNRNNLQLSGRNFDNEALYENLVSNNKNPNSSANASYQSNTNRRAIIHSSSSQQLGHVSNRIDQARELQNVRNHKLAVNMNNIYSINTNKASSNGTNEPKVATSSYKLLSYHHPNHSQIYPQPITKSASPKSPTMTTMPSTQLQNLSSTTIKTRLNNGKLESEV